MWREIDIQSFLTHEELNQLQRQRELRSFLVNAFKCYSCNTDYILKTKQLYRTPTLEYIVVSPLTGNCVKNNSQTSAVHDHMRFCKAVFCPEGFSILAKISCSFKLETQDSILINYSGQLWKKISPQYRYICFDIDCVTMHYLVNRRSNMINLWFISLIRPIKMLCKGISLSCIKYYWTLLM